MSQNKRLSIIFFVIVMGFILNLAFPVSVKAANEVILSLSGGSAKPGENVSLNVSIVTSQTLNGVTGIQWDFVFNPSNIMSVSVADGAQSLAANKTASCDTVSSGRYRCIVSGFNENMISDGILSVATFTLTDATTTPVYIQFSGSIAVDPEGNSVTIIATGNSILVDNTPPTASITYSNANAVAKEGDSLLITATFSEVMADSPIVKIAISGSVTQEATDMTKVNSTEYTYLHSVGPGNGEALVSLSVGADMVGNVIVAEPTSGATFIVDNTPPTTPTELSASAISTSQINLSWTASTDTTSVTGYQIYRNGSQINTSASNSYSDTGLSPGTAYSYTISAYDAAGNNSEQSSSVSATTQASGGGGGGSGGGGGGGSSGGSSGSSSGSSSGGSSGSSSGGSSGITTQYTNTNISNQIGAVGTALASGSCAPTSNPTLLTRNLYRSIKGDDVKILQNFLISQGHLQAVSLGTSNATGFFGPLTERAVQSFQKTQSIISYGTPITTGYGSVGPLTRSRINTLLNNNNCVVSDQNTEQIRAQIQQLMKLVNELMLKLQSMR